MASYQVSRQLAFYFQEKKPTLDFQDGGQFFLPSFKLSGLSFQEKKWRIDFQDGGHGSHLGFPIGLIFAIFAQKNHPDTSYQVSSQLAFWFRRRNKK